MRYLNAMETLSPQYIIREGAENRGVNEQTYPETIYWCI